MDGASIGDPSMTPCGGIFRNSRADHLGGFAFNLGVVMLYLRSLLESCS
jgi:hypothetical protein